MRFTLLSLCIAMLCGGLASPAYAQKFEVAFQQWKVFTYGDLCYIGSEPVSEKGNYSRRGKSYVLVTHRGKQQDEVSASSGYPYKPGKDVMVTIDGKSHPMFFEGEVAWAYDGKQDQAMVAAMKRGSKMSVRGTSKKDTWSEDHYSLSGFTAAYNKMKSLCK